LKRGFTLIEVMVALVLVSLMALLAWRGIDGMNQAVQQTAAHEHGAQRLAITLAQWSADLEAITETGVVKALDFDGQLLRLTRKSTQPAGVVVVAWVIRSGRLLRYAAPVAIDKATLQTTYLAAARWGRTPLPEDASRSVDLLAASNWQIFYFRGETWSNPLSSAGAAVTVAPAPAPASGSDVLPDGVRLILDIAPGSGLSGIITRDWVQPTLGATR
jgi:general secretion pathway protein J